jgi:hypothetical protein
MKKEEIKDLIKSFLITVAICIAFILSMKPQILTDILTYIGL